MKTTSLSTPRNRVTALLALLTAPLLLLMSSCAIDFEVEFTEDDTANVRIDFKMDVAELSEEMGEVPAESENMFTCDEFFTQMEDDEEYEYVTEDLSTDDALHCRMTATDVPLSDMDSEDMTLTNEGGVFTLESTDTGDFDDLNSPEMEGMEDLIQVSFTYAFPGKVLESNVGTIEGNKVVITDFTELGQNHLIKAESTSNIVDDVVDTITGGDDAEEADTEAADSSDGAGSTDNADTGENAEATDSSADSTQSTGISTGLIIGLIIAALLIIGLIVWLVTRKKDTNQPPTAPPSETV